MAHLEQDLKPSVKLEDSAGSVIDPATETTLGLVKVAIDELQARVGAIDTNPAANTMQDRLKAIKTVLDSISGYVDGLEGAFATLNGKDFATQATLASVLTELQAINTDVDLLATRLSESVFTGRLGEVQASPTANTLLGRTKSIEDKLDSIFTELVQKTEPTQTQQVNVLSSTIQVPTDLQSVYRKVHASTTTPLASAATYAPASENVGTFSCIAVATKSNVTGTLYVEESVDGSTWDISRSFAVVPNKLKTVRIRLMLEHVRLRYVNGADAQSTFTLRAMLEAAP